MRRPAPPLPPGCGRRRGGRPGRRPAGARAGPARWRSRSRTVAPPPAPIAIPAASSASSVASAMAVLTAWCRPRSPTRVGPRRGRSTSSPSRSQPRIGGRWTSVRGTASRRARRRMTASPSPRAPVTARSPRSMIAAFSRAIAVTVSPSRSMWSRSTLVTTATPPSQAWVASSRPPRPTSTRATSGRTSANQAKTTAVSSSNSVGSPWRRATRSATVRTRPTSRAKSAGGDRPAIDHDAFAVGHEVRLRRGPDPVAGGPQRGVGQGQDAALAVGPGDERAPDRPFRVVELAQQGSRPAQAQADPEPAALAECLERLPVAQAVRRLGHRRPVTHSRVSSSS